jgi:dienelactone hydrolase
MPKPVARLVGRVAVSTMVIAVAVGIGREGAHAAPVPPVHANAVGVQDRTFVDRERTTPGDVSAGITPEGVRRLPTTIFYPARGTASSDGAAVTSARPRPGRYPLVVFSGGSPGTPNDYAPLLTEWAAAGYVVAAPEFPISSLAGPDDVAWSDLPEQSSDARFVLDRMLALDTTKAGIAGIDEGRVAVAGHSFGGVTTLSLKAKCCRDVRVDAAVVLAGVTQPVDKPRLRALRGPVLFVHARRDAAVPYESARDACEHVQGWRRMLAIERIRGPRAHVVPYLGDDEYAAAARPAILDFFDGWVRDRSAARKQLARGALESTVATLHTCTPLARRTAR